MFKKIGMRGLAEDTDLRGPLHINDNGSHGADELIPESESNEEIAKNNTLKTSKKRVEL